MLENGAMPDGKCFSTIQWSMFFQLGILLINFLHLHYSREFYYHTHSVMNEFCWLQVHSCIESNIFFEYQPNTFEIGIGKTYGVSNGIHLQVLMKS